MSKKPGANGRKRAKTGSVAKSLRRKRGSSSVTRPTPKGKNKPIQSSRNPPAKRIKVNPRKTYKPTEIKQIFQQQREDKTAAIIKRKADKATRAFKPRKFERNKLNFVGIDGKTGAALKNRKGYLVFVNSKGQKKLVKQHKNGYKPAKLDQTEPPFSKRYRKQAKIFTQSKITRVGSGRIKNPRLSGKIKPKKGHEFNDATLSKLASRMRKAIESKASHRHFVLHIMASVKSRDGAIEKTIEIFVEIKKPDHISIKLGGLVNFVKHKVYSHLSRELAYDGLVSAGSSNHIRSLKANKGKAKKDWRDKNGDKWRSNENELVDITELEYRIQDAD